jgi:glutathione S-transferase
MAMDALQANDRMCARCVGRADTGFRLALPEFLGLDLAPWPGLGAYLERVAARPAVAAALKAEGLA